jgi:hypothetical protein
MASYQILISSERERARNPGLDINPSDFIYNFDTPLNLDSQFYEVCLLKLNVWNSVRNIVGQSLDFAVRGIPATVAIPDGQYSVEDLNAFLQRSIELQSLTAVGDIVIRPNLNTNRVEIDINDAAAQIDLSPALAQFLGFSAFGSGGAVTVSGLGTYTGGFIAQVTNGADAYQVRTDLHQKVYAQGRISDVLYQFTPAVPPQAAIDIDPVHLIYHQVNKSSISSIQIRYTDQTGRLLDFGGEDTSCILHLREITR